MSNAHAMNYKLICVSSSRGLQQYTARLANALASKSSVNLSVVGQKPLLNLLSSDVRRIELPGGKYSPRTVIALLKALFRTRDVVLHYQGVNLVTLLILYLAGFIGWRTVLTPHNVETHFPNKLYNMIKWPLWRRFDMVVLHTDSELKQVPVDLRSRIAVIPHGEYAPLEGIDSVSPETTKTVAELGQYVIAPGFVRDDKNIDYLIENVDILTRHGFRLVVAGSNRSSFPSNRIADVATHLDRFVSDSDLDHLIQNAAAVILPYDKVSESGILHQALSVGTPVIVSDIPGFRERVFEGRNGLFLSNFSAEALDEALKRLSSEGFDREDIARRHLAEFSWEAIASKLTKEVYARLIPY